LKSHKENESAVAVTSQNWFIRGVCEVLKKQADIQGNPVTVTLLHTSLDSADMREGMC
jgi:hypothetical protein